MIMKINTTAKAKETINNLLEDDIDLDKITWEIELTVEEVKLQIWKEVVEILDNKGIKY